MPPKQLADLFGWSAEFLGEHRVACTKALRCEQVLSLAIEPDVALMSAVSGCAAVMRNSQQLPAILTSKDPRAKEIEDVFARGGGQIFLDFIATYGGPIAAIPLIDEFQRTGEEGVRELLDLVAFPSDLESIKEAARTELAKVYYRAVVEEVEYRRGCGESLLLPHPINIDPDRPDIALPLNTAPENGMIDTASTNYSEPLTMVRYDVAALDTYIERYGKEVESIRAHFAKLMDEMPIVSEELTPLVELPDLTYGIEFEGYFQLEVPSSEGKRALREALAQVGLSDWKITEDGSIRRPMDVKESPRRNHPECVSPVLTRETAPIAIAKAMHVFRHLGLECNESCGLHVNVGDPFAIGLVQAKSVLLNYAYNQQAIDRILPIERRSKFNEYAHSPYHSAGFPFDSHEDRYAALKEIVLKARTVRELCGKTGSSGKTAAANIGKLDLGYIEFRQLHGTLNPAVVLDFASMCGMFVQQGRKHSLEVTALHPQFELGSGADPLYGPNHADWRRSQKCAVDLEGVVPSHAVVSKN